MSILKLKPSCKDYLWGGSRLIEEYGKEYEWDVLFIESGTIHAIGKDILIAEIQQNSNVTYRVYDYSRVGKEGKKRTAFFYRPGDVDIVKEMGHSNLYCK